MERFIWSISPEGLWRLFRVLLRREPFHGRCHCAFRFASRTWVRLQLDYRLKHQEKQGILQKQLLTSFLHLSYHNGTSLNMVKTKRYHFSTITEVLKWQRKTEFIKQRMDYHQWLSTCRGTGRTDWFWLWANNKRASGPTIGIWRNIEVKFVNNLLFVKN